MSDSPSEAPLDAADTRILAEISRDARATLATLAAAVGLSVSAVQARLRRLESRGVITGYRPILDAEAVGKPLAAFIEISPLDPAQPDTAPVLLEPLP
jgi:Lrp/AsnC family leucine-responsive transcriptional regulator